MKILRKILNFLDVVMTLSCVFMAVFVLARFIFLAVVGVLCFLEFLGRQPHGWVLICGVLSLFSGVVVAIFKSRSAT